VSVVLNLGIKKNNSAIPKSDSFAIKEKKVIVDHTVAVVAGIALIGLVVCMASIVPYRYYECKYNYTNLLYGQKIGVGIFYKTGSLSLFQYIFYIWNPDSVCLAYLKLSSSPFPLK